MILTFIYNSNDPDDLTVYIKFSNVGKTGLGLLPAYKCYNFPETEVQVYTNNLTNVSCCNMTGANVIKMRLEGIWYGLCHEHGHDGIYPKLWNWMPANITSITNMPNEGYSIVAAKPILPEPGCINFGGCKAFNRTETIAVKKISINMNPQCSIGNIDNGIPVSKSGPSDIIFDAISQIQVNH